MYEFFLLFFWGGVVWGVPLSYHQHTWISCSSRKGLLLTSHCITGFSLFIILTARLCFGALLYVNDFTFYHRKSMLRYMYLWRGGVKNELFFVRPINSKVSIWGLGAVVVYLLYFDVVISGGLWWPTVWLLPICAPCTNPGNSRCNWLTS